MLQGLDLQKHWCNRDQCVCGRAEEVRLLGEDKEMLGVFSLRDALAQAEDAEVDLVLLNADAQPPLARRAPVSFRPWLAPEACKK